MIVVDTNVVAYLWIPGPLTGLSSRLLERDGAWYAPPLWRSELRNVLLGHVRAGKGSLEAARKVMEVAEEQLAEWTVDVDSADVLRLGRESGCSAYDCELVSLARQLGIPLVTADRRLAKAFPGVARTLTEAVEGLP